MSRPPKSLTARSTARAGPSAVPRSTASWTTPGRPVSSASSSVIDRLAATTFTPWSASARVSARPMPLLAPVTTAVFPSSAKSTIAPRQDSSRTTVAWWARARHTPSSRCHSAVNLVVDPSGGAKASPTT